MEKGVTKEDLAWLVTRLIGVWFGYQMVLVLVVMIAAFPSMFSGSEEVFVKFLFQITFYLGLSLYFLLGGAKFVNLICHLPPAAPRNPSHLQQSEFKAFVAWLDGDLSRKYMSEKEQIAAFRAQRVANDIKEE